MMERNSEARVVYSETNGNYAYRRFEAYHTNYELVVTRVSDKVARNCGAHFIVSMLSPYRKCYPFDNNGYIHWSYVTEKLDIQSQKEAELIALTIMTMIEHM